MKNAFGTLPTGETAYTYTISCDKLSAVISDFGATLVRLYVPDSKGNLADVVLGFEDANAYANSTTFFGATVGRNANRIKNASFSLNGKTFQLATNENQKNNLHSGPDSYAFRIWQVSEHTDSSICFTLESPDKDQGFPGNASIRVRYTLTPTSLKITYDAVCDKDTVFNLTNHSYFNLAGHDKPELAMNQLLTMPARFFNPDDELNIPTGELRPVNGSPMDFRISKPIGRDLGEDYDALLLQGGYDHNFEVFCTPAAILQDPVSGRTMSICTDLPGIQVYSGNYLRNDAGKDGVLYCKNGGIALETQYYPDSVNHPEWPQPFTPANTPYHSETEFRFSCE